MKRYFVYIFTNRPYGTLYIGITSNLERRTSQHKLGEGSKFTQRYKLNRLVYFEETNDSMTAINREKQLKDWRRQWKIELIETVNPDWNDLAGEEQILNQVQDDSEVAGTQDDNKVARVQDDIEVVEAQGNSDSQVQDSN